MSEPEFEDEQGGGTSSTDIKATPAISEVEKPSANHEEQSHLLGSATSPYWYKTPHNMNGSAANAPRIRHTPTAVNRAACSLLAPLGSGN